MPIAQKFKALGAGNGFPFCPSKVDISNASDSTMWTTLSGVNADNYTSFGDAALAGKISQSLELAMKLYWNKFKINGLTGHSSGNNSGLISRFSGTSEVWDGSISGMTDQDVTNAGPLEPNKRVRGSGGTRILKSETVNGVDEDGDEVHSAGFELDEKSLSLIYGIYDAGKLLGYAFNEFFSSYAYAGTNLNTYNKAEVFIRGFGDNADDKDEDFHKQTTSYQEVNDFHFVVKKSGRLVPKSTPTADGYSGQVNQPSIIFTDFGVNVSYIYKWTYDTDDDPQCPVNFRFCFDKFIDNNYTFGLSGPTSIDFFTY
jgi:hypothetical protein